MDALGITVFAYQYDANDRLTSRTTAFNDGSTLYSYDAVGNLTTVAYPTNGTIHY